MRSLRVPGHVLPPGSLRADLPAGAAALVHKSQQFRDAVVVTAVSNVTTGSAAAPLNIRVPHDIER